MTPVALFLLTVAGIFVIGALGEIFFRRTSVPDVLWLMLAGIVLGPIGGLLTRERLSEIAPYFAALTLVVVLFEGGSRLRLRDVARAAPRSGGLALATFLLSVTAVALASVGARVVGVLPESWTLVHGVLLGTILGGSSSIIIMPAMAQARVDPRVAGLVNLESAFTDAFCVVGASALIGLLLEGSGAFAGGMIVRSFGIGVAAGGVAGLAWLPFLRQMHGSDHAYPVTLAALLALYVAIERAGGSAALGILTFAVILGNSETIAKSVRLRGDCTLGPDVRGFHSQLAFMIKSFFFTFIGAMLAPPWGPLLFGIVLGGVLLAARVPAVRAATYGGGLDAEGQRLVIVALPRGMAAGVLATMPAAMGVEGTQDVPTVVFACVLATVLIFAVGFTMARRSGRPDPQSASPAALVGATARAGRIDRI